MTNRARDIRRQALTVVIFKQIANVLFATQVDPGDHHEEITGILAEACSVHAMATEGDAADKALVLAEINRKAALSLRKSFDEAQGEKPNAKKLN